jgi:bifunctional non-homologous end joining protein LigD
VWQLETKPAGHAKQSVAATRLPDATSSTRNTNAEEVGTFELIEGDFEKGYAYLYFSGKSMQGDYTLARAGDANEWSLTRGFVAWGAVSDAARKTERGGTNERTSKSKSRVPSASPDFHVPSSERSSTFRVRRAKENHADGDRTARQEVLGVRKIAPSFIAPMECKLVERVPESDAWQYEVKLDGYRAIAVRHGSGATFYSRYGNELNSRFPQLARALRDCDLPECVLDGEIVALDAEGKPSFQELQNVKSSDRPIVYYVFDLLNLDGRDLTSLPLRKRRERLEQFESELCDPLRLSAAVHGDPTALLAVVREKGLEGVVAKRLDAPYESGKRSGRWVKYRARPREEFVIGGYLPGRHFLDAALVGCFEGKKLVFVKKLRNGFVPHTREQVFRAIEHLKTSKCPFANLPEPPDRRGAVTADKMKEFVWVRPQVWCEVEFAEWTAGGRLRHAAFRELLVKRAGHGR